MAVLELEKLVKNAIEDLNGTTRDDIIPLAMMNIEIEKVRQLLLIQQELDSMNTSLDYISNHLAAIRMR